VSSSGHYFRPYAKAMMERSNPDMSKDREIEAKQRENDARFIAALQAAHDRGEFPNSQKPEPQPEPRRTRPVPTATTRRSLFAVWEDDNA
jgi:hypothetical protein